MKGDVARLSKASLWYQLPAEMADVLRPKLDGIAAEMIDAIRREIPGYGLPLDSRLGRNLVSAVRRALNQFVELIENPASSQVDNALFFRRLGKAEFLNGRSMDLAQAAYRIGARVACHRYIQVARDANLPTETVLLLSEAVLVHINALANESVKGYAVAREQNTVDHRGRARRALAERLLERQADGVGEPLEALATRAGWPMPRLVACVLVEQGPGAELGPVHEGDSGLLTLVRVREAIILIPDPDLAGRMARVRAAVGDRTAVVGPALPSTQTWLSWQCCRSALRLLKRGVIAADGEPVIAADHFGTMLLAGNENLNRLLAEHVLAGLTDLSKGKATRLEETLDALLASWGRTAPEIADALGVHPQTARARIRQLEAVLGDQLTDPAFRLEAQMVLRARALLRAADERAVRPATEATIEATAEAATAAKVS